MQLTWEYYQELADGASPTVTHFTDNACRVFFIDPTNNNMIYQMKTEPVYGEFGGSEFTEKTVAYPMPNTQFFSTYYTPTKFLLATAIFNDRIALLVYNEQIEQFQTFQSFIYDMDYLIPKPDADIFLHTQPMQQKYIKIEVLNFDEIPFAEIEGSAIDGHIIIDLQSPIRRVCNLTLAYSNDLLPDIDKIIWLDRKFKIKLGIKDLMTDEIKWYDFGIFVISNPTTDIEIGEKTITIKGFDKTCFLNGDIAGQLEDIVRIDTKTPLYAAVGAIAGGLGREKKLFIDADACILKDMKNVKLYNPIKDLKTYDSYFAFMGVITVKINGITIIDGYTVDYVNYTIVFDNEQNPDDEITIDGDLVYAVPYDIEKSTNNTVWDLIDHITKLYMSFQSYYDVNGYFIFNKMRNLLTDPKVWDFSEYDVRMRCSNTFDFDNIRNYYKVFGAVLDNGVQIMVDEEIDDPDIPYSTAHIARRPLVITEDSYYTIEACQERLEYEKLQHTNFNEQITGECIPLLFLDVNSLIRLDFPDEGIQGVYCITNLNIPLKYDGMMTFSAYKVYQ